MGEVFAKQIMQLSGVSPDKAVAILEKYSTPKRCEGEVLSTNIQFCVDFTV